MEIEKGGKGWEGEKDEKRRGLVEIDPIEKGGQGRGVGRREEA